MDAQFGGIIHRRIGAGELKAGVTCHHTPCSPLHRDSCIHGQTAVAGYTLSPSKPQNVSSMRGAIERERVCTCSRLGELPANRGICCHGVFVCLLFNTPELGAFFWHGARETGTGQSKTQRYRLSHDPDREGKQRVLGNRTKSRTCEK